MQFLFHDRARADERHVASQDIQELRKLIQTPRAQKCAHLSNSRIGEVLLCSRTKLRRFQVRVGNLNPSADNPSHRAKLPDAKSAAPAANPLFAKENRAL